ncbi:SnoaL-like domain-containing protein [Maribacter antarcticus]
MQVMHGGSAGNPVVAGNHFVVPLTSGVTFKQRGRVQMDELCV